MDGETYRQHCILARLHPFVAAHHSDGRYVFWPDLTSAHYAKATTALLDHLDIPFVPEELNPPNVPELRPIENFWSLLKSAVYAGGWEASGEDQLRRKI